MTVKRIFGLHISFYYYGLDHLLINLNNYCRAAIYNNEKIIVYSEPKLYQNLKKMLGNIISKDNFFYHNHSKFINIYNTYGFNVYKLLHKSFISEAKKKGYSGLRLIVQPAYIIFENDKNQFLKVEKILNKLVEYTDSSILCIYDFEDYLTNQKFIDENVFTESFKTHHLNWNIVNTKQDLFFN